MSTDSRNIVISGSSKGLGRQLANYFQDHGFNVITMGYETPSDVDIRCNLLDLPKLKIELQKAFSTHGFIDILVCNAGTGKIPTGITSESMQRKYFLEKNLETAKNLVTAARPFLKNPGASIVGISSIAALSKNLGAPRGYGDAKYEMNRLFQNLALELASSRIRANLISPGNIFFSGSRWEEITLEDPESVEEMLRDKVPMSNFISPEEIAAAIVYLSSEEAKNITGSNLVIDGGQIL